MRCCSERLRRLALRHSQLDRNTVFDSDRPAGRRMPDPAPTPEGPRQTRPAGRPRSRRQMCTVGSDHLQVWAPACPSLPGPGSAARAVCTGLSVAAAGNPLVASPPSQNVLRGQKGKGNDTRHALCSAFCAAPTGYPSISAAVSVIVRWH